MSLARHAIRSTLSGSVFQLARVAANLGGAVVVARILSPAEYGTFALAISFNGLVLAFRHAGLPLAATGRSSLSPGLESNLFWLTLAVGTTCSLVLLALAPFVGWYYGSAEVGWVAAAIAATLVVEAASAQHAAKLRREMRFDAVNGSELFSVLLGAVAAIGGALAGLGVWALVLQRWAAGVGILASTWWLAGWFPSWPRRGVGTRALVGVGSWLMLYEFIWLAEKAIREAVIGRLAPVASFGQFSRAQWLVAVPEQVLAAPVRAVAAPVLSRVSAREDDAAGRREILRAVGFLDTVGAVAVGMIVGGAHDAFLVLLGPQWIEGARLFQVAVISLVGTASASFLAGLVVTVSHGRGWAWIALANAILMLAGALGGYFIGDLQGATVGMVTATLVSRFTAVAHPLSRVGVGYGAFLRTVAPPTLACAASAAAGVAVRLVVLAESSPWLRGACSVLASLLVGATFAWCVPVMRSALVSEWRRIRTRGVEAERP
jgi:PST family polysaccharide transporter